MCVQSLCKSLNIKECILFELHPLSISYEKMSKLNTRQNKKKIMKPVHKIGGEHHCAKFEYKGMNTAGVTDYTN